MTTESTQSAAGDAAGLAFAKGCNRLCDSAVTDGLYKTRNS
jgi:hypothetical protein